VTQTHSRAVYVTNPKQERQASTMHVFPGAICTQQPQENVCGPPLSLFASACIQSFAVVSTSSPHQGWWNRSQPRIQRLQGTLSSGPNRFERPLSIFGSVPDDPFAT
jgi:hypothetical protein